MHEERRMGEGVCFEARVAVVSGLTAGAEGVGWRVGLAGGPMGDG